jgi:hypothetical protein
LTFVNAELALYSHLRSGNAAWISFRIAFRRIVQSSLASAPSAEEKVMRQHYRPFVFALAFLGGLGLAVAQNASSQAPGAAFKLTEEQKRTIAQGLQDKDPQALPPGTQAEVGKKLPEVIKLRPMPPEIYAIVPEAQDVLYVRLPDRVVLLDPVTQISAEIILDRATTGNPAR